MGYGYTFVDDLICWRFAVLLGFEIQGVYLGGFFPLVFKAWLWLFTFIEYLHNFNVSFHFYSLITSLTVSFLFN